jgi:hypothetical protein
MGAREIPYRQLGQTVSEGYAEEEQIPEEGIFDYNWMPEAYPEAHLPLSHAVPYVDPPVPENGGTDLATIPVYGIFATGRRPVLQTYDPLKPRMITAPQLRGWGR